MQINRKRFFDSVRHAPFGGSLTHGQVDGLTRILDEWERRGIADKRHLGYMLSTVFWETARTVQPIREMGSEAYLRSKPYYPWVGEGLVQVTWEANAKKFGAKKPGDLLTWPIALVALFDGMEKGMFTGHKLSDYFNDKGMENPTGARQIINGLDHAADIAHVYHDFMTAITAANAAVSS